jgi:competence protein ComGF
MNLHDHIQQIESSVPYGTIQFTIKRADHNTTHIESHKMTQHKTDGNDKALAIVISMLKAAAAAKESGNITFTIVMKDGESNRIMVQDTKLVRL